MSDDCVSGRRDAGVVEEKMFRPEKQVQFHRLDQLRCEVELGEKEGREGGERERIKERI